MTKTGSNLTFALDAYITATGNGNSNTCLIESCGKVHRSAKTRRPSQCLAFCPIFRKLVLNQRFSIAKKLKLCLRCLQPNHQLKDCRMTQLKCRTCGSESHATLLCRSAETGDQAGGKVKQTADGASSFTTDTGGKAIELPAWTNETRPLS